MKKNKIKIHIEEVTQVVADQTELATPTVKAKGDAPDNVIEVTQVQSPGYVDGGTYITDVPVSEVEPNLRPEYIKKGKKVFGVEGTAAGDTAPGSATITENGKKTYTPQEGIDGFSDFTVDVNVQPNLEDKTVEISTNGTKEITAQDGYDGLGTVKVITDVKGTVKQKTITKNGVYDATKENVDGYNLVNVSVDPPALEKDRVVPIKKNGLINIKHDPNYYGMDNVLVDVQTSANIQEKKTVKRFEGDVPDNYTILPDVDPATGKYYDGIGKVVLEGFDPILEPLSVIMRENTKEPMIIPVPEGRTGYGTVSVSVNVEPNLTFAERTITDDLVLDIHDPEWAGFDGFAYVIVHPVVKTKLFKIPAERLHMTENAVYDFRIPEGYNGLDAFSVDVDVHPVLDEPRTVTITEQGTKFYPEAPLSVGMKQLTVSAALDDTLTKKENITNKKTYYPKEGTLGFAGPITIDMEGEKAKLASKTVNITNYEEVHVYTASRDAALGNPDGYDVFTINVDIPRPKLARKTITVDRRGPHGPYIAREDTELNNPDGYSEVIVDVQVPYPDLEQKTVNITKSGQLIKPSEGFDGMDSVKADLVYDKTLPATLKPGQSYQPAPDTVGFAPKTITVEDAPAPNIEPSKIVDITENHQVINPSAGYAGQADITVDLNYDTLPDRLEPGKTYTPASGTVGYQGPITVGVQNIGPYKVNGQDPKITKNNTRQTFSATDINKDGISTITVDVRIPEAVITPVQEFQTITENNKDYTLTATADGMKAAKFRVEIPEKVIKLKTFSLEERTITANTTPDQPIKFQRGADFDGLDDLEVFVNVPEPVITETEYFYDSPITKVSNQNYHFVSKTGGMKEAVVEVEIPWVLNAHFKNTPMGLKDLDEQDNLFVIVWNSDEAQNDMIHNPNDYEGMKSATIPMTFDTLPEVQENGKTYNADPNTFGFKSVTINVPAPKPPKIVDTATFTFNSQKDYPLPAGAVEIPLNVYECDEVENRDAEGMKTALFKTNIAEFPKTPLKNGQTVELPAGAVAFEGPITVNVESAVMPADQPFEYKLRGVNPVEYVDWDKNAPPELKEKYDGFKKIKIIQRYQEIPKITKNGDIPLKVDPQYGNKYYTGFMHRMANGNYGLEVDVKPELQTLPTITKNGVINLGEGKDGFAGPITVNVDSAVMPENKGVNFKLYAPNDVAFIWSKDAPADIQAQYDGLKRLVIRQNYQEVPKITKNGVIPLGKDSEGRTYSGFMHRTDANIMALEVDVKPELQVVPKITANPVDGKIKLDKGKDGFIGTGPNGELEIDVKAEASEYDGSLLESLCMNTGVEYEKILLKSNRINEIKPDPLGGTAIFSHAMARGATNPVFVIDMPNLHKIGYGVFGGKYPSGMPNSCINIEIKSDLHLVDYQSKWFYGEVSKRIRGGDIYIDSFDQSIQDYGRNGLLLRWDGDGGKFCMPSTVNGAKPYTHFHMPERAKFENIKYKYLFGPSTAPYKDSITAISFINDEQQYELESINSSTWSTYFSNGYGCFETNGWIHFTTPSANIATGANSFINIILTSKRKCTFTTKIPVNVNHLYVPDELYEEYKADPLVPEAALFKISQLPEPYHTVTVDNWEPPQTPTV